MKPKIFCLILNYKRHQDTITCVNSLNNSDLPRNTQVIVLDNSEGNASAKVIKNNFPKIKIIKNKTNLGFAAGNNIGIKYALEGQATHILIINPDVKVPKVFFKPLLADFKNNPTAGLLAPALKHKVKNKTYFGLDGYMDWEYAKPRHYSLRKIIDKKLKPAKFLTFACVLIKAEVFEKTGLLDERYFMYLEDVDFCLTARKKKFTLYLDPAVVATHQTSASFSHPRHKLKISYVSHVKFIHKWLSFPRNIIAWSYQSLHYPYLYLLWTYHHWRYRSIDTA